MMNNEINTYVICSTLNQMVNYLPLKVFSKYGSNKIGNQKVDIKTVYYITIEAESESESDFKRFPNEKWDKSFEKVIENDEKLNHIKIKPVKISRNMSLNICDVTDVIKKAIEDDEDKPILWNITGGQRNLLVGIYRVIEERKSNRIKNDKVIYLEGNSNKMMVLEEQGDGNILSSQQYFDKDLRIETALELAGFDMGKETSDRSNLLEIDFKNEYKKYLCLYEQYKIDDELRKMFMRLNKKSDDVCFAEIIEYLKNKEMPKLTEYVEKMKEDFGTNNPFGYILEYMSVAVILKNINEKPKLKDYFVDMLHSGNIYFSKNNIYKEYSSKSLFEFDIVLLSKSGQMVIFECKSGAMSGETAKARKYSVYAVGGVYGKPIIITPLLQEQIDNIDCKVEDRGKELETIEAAIKSAKRAEMEVWGIDQISVKLEQLFNEAIE